LCEERVWKEYRERGKNGEGDPFGKSKEQRWGKGVSDLSIDPLLRTGGEQWEQLKGKKKIYNLYLRGGGGSQTAKK